MNAFSLRWPFGKSRGGSGREEGDGLAAEEEFGVTEHLCSFVRGLTAESFRKFQIQDHVSAHGGDRRSVGSLLSTNSRKDLTGWQEKHAVLVLARVKELSQLRYALCPRHLKEEYFWLVYFQLVRSYVAPYETRAVQKAKVQMMLQENKKSGRSSNELEMTEAKRPIDLSPVMQ